MISYAGGQRLDVADEFHQRLGIAFGQFVDTVA